ncbi:glyxalase domain-containing protein [Desulfonema limicola]|uniref:Glyxalase domain-containing protein n=1 Tax=Desulfonema limicola TaxID=45656 RepID=A0A975B792_9BACT|nr:isoprenoid biosynthesis glyoxalase ElbB [Desulfonema limicola]QTA80155.1 glyxalase domain-containing protein [Desulfonema limicola]
MGKKVGVVLSGCGVYDGSEIHEAVLTLFYLDKAGAETICMAPDMDFDTVNHLSQEKTGEMRNTLIESARIARGEIKNIKDIKALNLDAIIFPGGFGAAKNLSNFAEKGPDAVVHPEVDRILNEMVLANKPVGAICIAPAAVAKALSSKKPEVTIGSDQATASAIESAGGKHFVCAVDQIHIDQKNKIVTTPAYMLGPGIKDIAAGIEKLVNQIVSMA